MLYQGTLITQCGVFAVAGLATVSLKLRKSRIGGIPFYFVMSHIAMGIGLVRGLFWSQRGTWQRTKRTPLNSASREELQLTEHAS